MEKREKIAIVTGASSGLGRELALLLDQESDLDEIVLCARRKNRLEELAKDLRHRTRVLAGDITEESFYEKLEAYLVGSGETQKEITYLVNSAGLGQLGSFQEIGLAGNLAMVDLNIKALTVLCFRCLPFMRKGGKILNIASVAAFLPQANFAVYAASKAYVLSFSRALNQDLKKRGITVTAVCPNPMETEFFDLTGDVDKARKIKNLGLEEVDQVAKLALKRAKQGRDISVLSFPAKLIRLAARIFPHNFILWFESKIGL